MIFPIAKFYEEHFLQREIFDYSLLNCIAKKASTKRSWRWHQRPAAKNRQFSTESPNVLTFFPLVYEYKWFLGPSYETAEDFQTQGAGGGGERVIVHHAKRIPLLKFPRVSFA